MGFQNGPQSTCNMNMYQKIFTSKYLLKYLRELVDIIKEEKHTPRDLLHKIFLTI